MLTALVDYDSGNLHSARKAFEKMARETGAGQVVVTADPDTVARADRIVLPGDGAFPHCRGELFSRTALAEAIIEAVTVKARPFFGICVGMQMLATTGHEYEETPGFGWIAGDIRRITPADPALKVPHMGWNDLVIDNPTRYWRASARVSTPISCIPTRWTSPTPPNGWPMWITAAMSPPSPGATRSSAHSSIQRKARRQACA